MKLKRLTLFAFVLMSAIAFSISGCKDDDGTPPGGDDGGTAVDPNAPVVTLYTTGAGGDLYWTFKNKTVPLGEKIRFGVEVQCPTEIAKVELIRKTTAGPQNGTSIVVWDTTLNETFTTKTRIKEELIVEGVVATQVVVFTFKITAKNGLTGETSVEIKPEVSVGLREAQSLFDRTENGAYDLVQAVSLSKANETSRHDLKLAASGDGFKFVSGNGSKFKLYIGTTGFDGFTNNDRINTAWNASGAELTETPKLEEFANDYDFILVKSAQNNSIYVVFVYEIKADEVLFDYRGEGL